MLFYSLFPEEKLCIFSVAGKLTIEEMRNCFKKLNSEPAWPGVQTIVSDLRGCWDVDVFFESEKDLDKMERTAFGNRRLIWLTGSSQVLGKLSMAASQGESTTSHHQIFQTRAEMSRYLGQDGDKILGCLDNR